MKNYSTEEDSQLVKDCLSGSDTAWNEFYTRFSGLIRSLARRKGGAAPQDVEDLAQTAFCSLATALHSYDPSYPLARFVASVTERVCIDEYRRRTAYKRDAITIPVEHHDGIEEGAGATIVPSNIDPPDRQLAKAQLVDRIKRAFRHLGEQCRKVLRLRFIEDLAYKDIREILGIKENTLRANTRRCLLELRAVFDKMERTGGVK